MLAQDEVTHIQQVIGNFFYYARAVDHTMLTALGEMATTQTVGRATMKVADNIIWFLNYAATHPNTKIRYHASGMVLHIDSDASYLSVKNARSRVGGHFYLSTRSDLDNKPPTNPHPSNGPLHVVCSILRNVMASAAEAELGGLFYNAKEACVIQIILKELGHPQPATPIKTDNTTASGIVNKTIKPKKSKSMDMQFHWVIDRVGQGQFIIYWQLGDTNKGDYYTKHHSAAHHREIRYTYLQPTMDGSKYANRLSPQFLRGCANLAFYLGSRPRR